jgi:LysM repeat protein
VKADETYSSISRKYKISTDVLIAANPKIKPTSLREGQVINLERQTAAPAPTTSAPVPPPAPTPPVAKAPSNPAPPAPAPQPATPTASQATPESPAQAPNVAKKVRPIVIEQEITYGEFASKHGTDTERLNALNGLDLTAATVLAKGSELYVPGQ